MLRTGTLALAAVIAALFLGGASAHAAAEAPPANDNFASAVLLLERVGAHAGTNVEATKELDEPDHAGVPGGASVWFRWNSTQGGRAHFSTCDSETDFDTVLAVYTGVALNALTPIASSNDDCGGNRSILSFATTPNTDYWIAIDGVGAATGAFLLDWFQRPHNDDRAKAEPITGESGTLVVSNELASLEPGEPEPAGPGGSSVWYSWTAPSSGPVRFDTCASAFNDTLLAAYEGDSSTPLAADDDDFCASGSLISFTAEAGKAYKLSVDGYFGEQFDDTVLNWSRQGAPPTPPESDERPTISGTPQEGETLSAGDGTWFGTPPFTFTYEWARCNEIHYCQRVPGALAKTYALGPADVTFRMVVFVTATNSVGSATVVSFETGPVISRPRAAPRNTALPTIVGTPAENQTLTTTAGGWDGYPAPLFAFQWQSCTPAGAGCRDIDGEIEPSLVLSRSEVGRRIRVLVLARNDAGASTATSGLTAAVRGNRPATRARCVVPNVRGKKLAAARKAITNARCRVGRVTRSWSARVAAGKVIRQRPAPRTRLAPRSRIHLVVSRGRRR